MIRRFACLAAVVLIVAGPARAADKHPLTLDDLGLIKGVGAPQLSPDGLWIVTTISTTDYENNRSSSQMTLISTTNGSARELGAGSSPQWSPDGKTIAYRAARDGKSGIWLYDMTANRSRFLVTVHSTSHFLGHSANRNFEWSPNGLFIAFVGGEAPVDDDTPDTIYVTSRILFKTRTSFTDNRASHVWFVPVTGGEPILLTPGRFDEHSISWSPDNRRIAFISNRSQDPDDNYTDDLWTVDVATQQVRRLTTTLGTEFQPAWSPNGRSIAFVGTVRPINTKDSAAENPQLYVIPAGGGPVQNLTAALDRRISNIRWHPSGLMLYFTSRDRGATAIFRVAVDSAQIRRITDGDVRAGSFSLDRDARLLAYGQSDLTHPTEIWLAGPNGESPRQLTHYNDPFLEVVEPQSAEMLWFDSFDGTPVQGWLMKPAGFAAGRKYPLILSVHGGPHGMYGYSFSTNIQQYAAEGYGVLFLNPRGSTGYGQAFADGCLLNWGGGDYKDLMAGVDHVVKNYEWVDKDRLGVIGGSYGGFMTNWIITQTDRFKAAVSRASVSNLISFYGTSLYHLLIEEEFNGKPWDNYALLWHWSPLNHVRNVKTPTLFIHGENDHDVPITQAEEMYIAVRKMGVEATLVRYAGEGHGIRRPQHRLDSYRRTMAWFDKYVKGKTGAGSR